MAVLIDSGPVSATQRLADVPSERWGELVRARRSFCAVDLPYDCRELLHFVEEAHEMMAPLGYADATDFLKRGLELDPKMVEWALQGLRRLKPDEAIPFKRAIELGKHGGDRKTEKVNQGSNTTLVNDRGRDYILARLQRDGHSDLMAQIYAGELSAHAAAKQVGYRKQPDVLRQLQKLWAKASEAERQSFVQWVNEP